jgi:hypothetical protein
MDEDLTYREGETVAEFFHRIRPTFPTSEEALEVIFTMWRKGEFITRPEFVPQHDAYLVSRPDGGITVMTFLGALDAGQFRIRNHGPCPPIPETDRDRVPGRPHWPWPEPESKQEESASSAGPALKPEPGPPASARPAEDKLSVTDWLQPRLKAYDRAGASNETVYADAVEAFGRGELERPPKNAKTLAAIRRRLRRARTKGDWLSEQEQTL